MRIHFDLSRNEKCSNKYKKNTKMAYIKQKQSRKKKQYINLKILIDCLLLYKMYFKRQ